MSESVRYGKGMVHAVVSPNKLQREMQSPLFHARRATLVSSLSHLSIADIIPQAPFSDSFRVSQLVPKETVFQ